MRPNVQLKALTASLLLASTHAAAIPVQASTNGNTPALDARQFIVQPPSCSESGPELPRRDMTKAIDDFCNAAAPQAVTKERALAYSAEYPFTWPDEDNEVAVDLVMRTAGEMAISVDVGSCEAWFRQIMDNCDTDSTRYKQGGTFVVSELELSITTRFLKEQGPLIDWAA